MSWRALAAAPLLALAASGAAQDGPARRGPPLIERAVPSEVVAAELAFARTAQEKGQWTAFAQFAAKNAVMFVPQAVNARSWLKGRANPADAVKWQPHEVWASCDGSLAVTRGAWQRPDGTVGYFTTVWQREGRDPKKKTYRWVMDQGDNLAEPLAAPEFIAGKVAECTGPSFRPRQKRKETFAPPVVRDPVCSAAGDCTGGGTSADGTLVYDYTVAADGARQVRVTMLDNGTMREVLRSAVAAG